MTAVWLAIIFAAAAGIVLAAVAASAMGPIRSLRRSASRLSELRDEVDSLRRGTDVLRRRAEEIRTRRGGDGPT